jgi:heterodisulfide reductase subunit B
MSGNILSNTQQRGADVVAVACPLCHLNLDGRQGQMEDMDPIPVMYFTQLLAVAFGHTEDAALKKNLVDPRPILSEHALL